MLLPQAQASAVLFDPQSGQVLALVGDTSLSQGEAAALSAHPTGSLLTPFIDVAGFARGLGPASLVWDIPSSLPTIAAGQPNPDGKFHGPVRLRLALANDYLAPAAQLLAQVGPENVWGLAQPFGLPSLSGEPLPYDGGRLTLLQVAQAYGVFANGGVLAGRADTGALQPGVALSNSLLARSGISNTALVSITVLDVKGVDGHTWLDWSLPASRPILSAPLVYLLNHVLSDETARWPSLGAANPLEIGRPAAAKLGQTASGVDTWTAGYTPHNLAAVWVGLPPTAGTSSPLDPRIAAGLWHALIQYIARDVPPEGWSAPPGISTVEVCDPSGLLPTSACPNVVSEVFLTGSEPTGGDTLYQTFQINRETGRLATVFTSPGLVEERTYLVVPPEARQWAEATGLDVPPDRYDTIQAPAPLPDAQFTSPALFDTLAGEVTLKGVASGESFVSYRLQIGQGLNPRSWTQLGDEQTSPVTGGTLGFWDTRQQPDGLYAVRLVVVRQDQRVETAILQVTVDNTPPEVTILYPSPGQALTGLGGKPIIFQARASDALSLERVEWWVDGKLAGSLTQAPFSLPWQGETGAHSLVVKGFDRAGNEAETPPVNFTVN